MLDFPSSGLVAGVTTVTGPSGQVWMWDGKKWIAVGGAGGDGGGGWPAMGVTDGSNAAAGQVGEVISVYNLIYPPWDNVATLQTWAMPGIAMGAGDWNVEAVQVQTGFTVSVTAAQPARNVFFSINCAVAGSIPQPANAAFVYSSTDVSTVQGVDVIGPLESTGHGFSAILRAGPFRVLTSTASPLVITMNIQLASAIGAVMSVIGSTNNYVWVYARRMR